MTTPTMTTTTTVVTSSSSSSSSHVWPRCRPPGAESSPLGSLLIFGTRAFLAPASIRWAGKFVARTTTTVATGSSRRRRRRPYTKGERLVLLPALAAAAAADVAVVMRRWGVSVLCLFLGRVLQETTFGSKGSLHRRPPIVCCGVWWGRQAPIKTARPSRAVFHSK